MIKLQDSKMTEVKAQVYSLLGVETTAEVKARFSELDLRCKSSWVYIYNSIISVEVEAQEAEIDESDIDWISCQVLCDVEDDILDATIESPEAPDTRLTVLNDRIKATIEQLDASFESLGF